MSMGRFNYICGCPEVLVDSIPSWGSDGDYYKTFHSKTCMDRVSLTTPSILDDSPPTASHPDLGHTEEAASSVDTRRCPSAVGGLTICEGEAL
jgi:hypothetical protein